MESKLALIGYGEAATAFAPGLTAVVAHFDRLLERSGTASDAEALTGAEAALSLVTADQALPAALSAARHIPANAFFFDMNSVAPDTKRAAAQAIEAAGGRYVDVAVMAPVHPPRTGVPLLVSGPHAGAGAAFLTAIGFSNVRVVPGDIGRASSIKMIRSVMVKGIEALSAECVLAADAAGVLDEVLASLDASPAPAQWAVRADYNLERMIEHGLRRAAEMEEVVKTLGALGTGSAMTRGTVMRQRAIGALGLAAPETLAGKLAVLASNVTPAEAGVPLLSSASLRREPPALAGVTEYLS
jgi:3-hydroxyisobutyrate dehydrogenase-like beta-hydroxyacid dehydrogenase